MPNMVLKVSCIAQISQINGVVRRNCNKIQLDKSISSISSLQFCLNFINSLKIISLHGMLWFQLEMCSIFLLCNQSLVLVPHLEM